MPTWLYVRKPVLSVWPFFMLLVVVVWSLFSHALFPPFHKGEVKNTSRAPGMRLSRPAALKIGDFYLAHAQFFSGMLFFHIVETVVPEPDIASVAVVTDPKKNDDAPANALTDVCMI
jgi:hypothetical protein